MNFQWPPTRVIDYFLAWGRNKDQWVSYEVLVPRCFMGRFHLDFEQ